MSNNRASIATAGNGFGGSVVKTSPTSPDSLPSATLPPSHSYSLSPSGFRTANPGQNPKRKRNSMSGPGSSPVHDEQDDEPDDKRLRLPGVKRACNECRQQKLRCNVVQDPFQPCARCLRLGFECKIESSFKRVGKRSRQAEMGRQIERMEQLLRQARANGFIEYDDEDIQQSPMMTPGMHHTHTRNTSLMGSEEAVSSLLHLKTGGGQYALPYRYRLGDVELLDDEATGLFRQYFTHFHRFLPFLVNQPPRAYYEQHPVLFWSIISVGARRWPSNPGLLRALEVPFTRLVWDTIAGLPTSHHVVKALCLLCTWRLPTSTTANDPTHVLCGTMLKIATGIGLHRPNHVQDFSRDAVSLNADQVHDRVLTWAVCNIVAQSVGTGYGQPASTLYDWTLSARPEDKGPFALSEELDGRLRIEMFCDRVSKEMYSNGRDPRGVAGDEHRTMLMRIYKREFYDLQQEVQRLDRPSSLVGLHLKAAQMHLRLAGFYDSSKTKGYTDDLVALWQATTAFLEDITQDVGGQGGTDDNTTSKGNNKNATTNSTGTNAVLPYASNYLQQMLVAGGFSLLKLLGCSWFTPLVDVAAGRALFNRTVIAIRATSVTNNDLQARLAELMVQMWNGHKLGRRIVDAQPGSGQEGSRVVDDSLQLKVRCRHSMSHVYDTIWRWRAEFLDTKRSSLDALSKHATKPESVNESSASSTSATHDIADPQPPPQHHLLQVQAHQTQQQLQDQDAASLGLGGGGGSGMLSSRGPTLTSLGAPVTLAPPPPPSSSSGISGLGGLSSMTTSELDYFDPNTWMLDNLVDFPYGPSVFSVIEQHV